MSLASVDIIQSWGVASARNTSCCTVRDGDSEYLYDVPIGPSMIRWDIKSQKRLMQFQAHSDLVTCTRQSPDGSLTASSSYSGEVKLWSPQWVCLDRTQTPMTAQHHLAWSEDSKRFLIIGNGKSSSIMVYDVSTTEDKSGTKLKLAWTLHAIDQSIKEESQSINDSDGIIETGESTSEASSGRNYPYEDAFFMAEFNPSGNVFAVKELPYRTTLIHVISPEGTVMKTEDLMATLYDEESTKRPMNTLFLSPYRDGMYAIGLEGGSITLIDAESLDVVKAFKVGSGFRTCIWDKSKTNLIVASDSGKVSWWGVDGERVAEFSSGMQDYVVHMSWSISGNALWICGFSYLAFLTVERNDAGEIKSVEPSLFIYTHDITSVGVGFSPSGTKLGSGDMVGNVWVTEKDSISPIYICLVNASVRCLTWRTEEIMIIGTLDGSIYSWRVNEVQPQLILQLDGSIIRIRFDHRHELLAVGTSKGILQVLRMGEEATNITTVQSMTAHLPQPESAWDQRFGQLGKQAEIWSLCWSPDDSKLATCSEDQTVKVWETDSWKCITTLTGHALAVTSVDWIQHGKWSLLVSCSDDRTVRLVNGESFELLDVVNTRDIYGWHTLTYLSFFPYKDSSLLLCTTQNGHLVVWSIESSDDDDESSRCWLQRSWSGKLHLGSIEGLAWQDKAIDGGSIATVGADCVVNLFRIV